MLARPRLVDELRGRHSASSEHVNGCSLGVVNLRKSVINLFGGEALQLSSQTYYVEIHAVRGGIKQEHPYSSPTKTLNPPHPQTAEPYHTHK